GLTVLAALVGLGRAWMPPPFDAVGSYMMLIGLLIMIVFGNRAAFRADSAGIFAFWWKPVKMATSKVDDSEQWPLFLGLVAAISPVLSMVSRIVWLG
ncbi:MAG: hypothetical protein WBN61_00450, partial [Woeseiaceae bacterium]